ncbi:MAG: pyrroloquinoline quinone biosynthesis protein PqqB [Pseudomonadota bacterium]
MTEPRLRIRVLGSAAGGGLPQWNCGCTNCMRARWGEIPSRTQSSIAVSVDGRSWAIANASPDLRQQIADAPVLWPSGARESPIQAVLLTNGEIDHVAGLLTLREKTPFAVHATAEIHRMLSTNRIFDALDPAVVSRPAEALGVPFALLPGLEAELFAVPGKAPLHVEEDTARGDLEDEQTVGVAFSDGMRQVFYVPGCARLTPDLVERFAAAELVLFDGTLWADDEMIGTGLGEKTTRRLSHMPMAGPEGSLAAFAEIPVGRKVFVHMNSSNPVLDPESPQRRTVEGAGWTVAEDGMELYP